MRVMKRRTNKTSSVALYFDATKNIPLRVLAPLLFLCLVLFRQRYGLPSDIEFINFHGQEQDSISPQTGGNTVATKDNLFPKLHMLGQKLLTDAITDSTSEWERDLFQRLDRIREACGELCAINDRSAMEKYNVHAQYDRNDNVTLPYQLQVPLDCDAIMSNEDMDVGDPSIPRRPPKELIPYYTIGGLAQYSEPDNKYFNQTYVGTDAATPVWTEDFINGLGDAAWNKFRKGAAMATYGYQPNKLFELLEKYTSFENKRVLVVGTEHPWLEAACLKWGAREVVTLEYGVIKSEHPKISTLLPSEFRKQYKDGTLEPFDMVLSFSSLEHPGLGRYGDALNPWGDVLAVARAYCVTKPGGILGLGMPGREGDHVLFNECRSYGPYRWSLISANWKQIDGPSHGAGTPWKGRHRDYLFQKPF